MRSMSKKIARGKSECVQRTGIVSKYSFILDVLLPS